MCDKRKTRAILGLIVAGVGSAVPAEAGFVQGNPPHITVRLEPDHAGPYSGEETLTVDVWLQNEEPLDLALRTVAVDFSLTDPNLALGPEFNFDTTIFPVPGVFNTFPEFPRPYAHMPLLCCPDYNIQLSVNSQVHLGALDLTFPTEPGLYTLDALNATEPDWFVGGAYVHAYVQGTGVPLGFWHAYDGEIRGDSLELQVIPEPATVALFTLGTFAVLGRRRKRCARGVRTGVLAITLTIVWHAGLVARPAEAGFVQMGAPHVLVSLQPDHPGPYLGGDTVTVDVWLHNEEPVDLALELVGVDFSLSDPNLTLSPEFTFDTTIWPFPEVVIDYPELPRVWCQMPFTWLDPALAMQLPASSSVHFGSLDVALPVEPGVYTMDALNTDEPEPFLGGAYVEPHDPVTGDQVGAWHAYTGDIAGDSLELQVIPEPATVALVGLGGLMALAFSKKRSGK